MSHHTIKQSDPSQTNLYNLLKRLWHHLGLRRQRQFVLLFCLMMLSAFAEMISLGAVMPFLGVLISPDRVFNYSIVAKTAKVWGIASPADLVLLLSIVFAVAALFAGSVRILLLWSSTRLAYVTGADLSIDIYRRTLYQPYKVHVARNSSEVISSLAYKVNGALNVLYMMLMLISSMVLLVVIMIALLAINAGVAIAAVIGFGGSYGLITWLFRKRLAYYSKLIARDYTLLTKAQHEGLCGIRDVLLEGTQPFYCNIYRQADYPLRMAMGDIAFIAGSPRFVMEAISMALIAALAYMLSRQPEGAYSALLLLGTLAMGAQRLLPALQQAYVAWTSIAGHRDSLFEALEFLDQPLSAEALQPPPPPLDFQGSIRFDNVYFRYTSNGTWVLGGIDLTLPKGHNIGFVGSTGSGKSTLLDLLMGLMDPTEGQVLVDGLPISGERLRAWRRTIAHVPQSIYLADVSLAENIAFGVPYDEIDMERVRQAARQARISDFIESSSDGYGAVVGERGVRLSGGQRQRIGIARALYKQATILVFDEATSALDNTTEQEVMEAIEGLGRDLTIIIVAHRLTTVKHCDIIIELGQGKILAQGTYESLLERSPSFRRMANVNA